MEIQFVHHEPARTYDKVCRVNHMLYLAGEDSKDTATQEVRGKDVAEQTEILFQNLKNTLESFGSGLDYIIKMTVYLVDRNDRNIFSAARARCMNHTPPSTLIMGIQLAEPEMLVEVDATAVIPNESTRVIQ